MQQYYTAIQTSLWTIWENCSKVEMTRISEEILVKDEVENKAVKAKTKKGMEKGK